METARTDTVLPWWVPDNNIRLRGTGYGTSIDDNKPMRVSSSDSPRSLEFRVDGGQPGHYSRFGETSELPVNRPATMECQGEKPTLWGPTREYQCFYDVQSQGVEREICERTNAQDEFKRDA